MSLDVKQDEQPERETNQTADQKPAKVEPIDHLPHGHDYQNLNADAADQHRLHDVDMIHLGVEQSGPA